MQESSDIPLASTLLEISNRKAVSFTRSQANERRKASLQRISAVLQRTNCSATADVLITTFPTNSRVAIHFHPDRYVSGGQSVTQSLLESGIYKSQFETQISNGGLTAYRGGDRDKWEERLFGGAYNESPAHERPKYGALDLLWHPDGPAPRFGSCYFVMKQHVLERCTFSMGDSCTDPTDRGTIDSFEAVLAGLLERVEKGTNFLGKEKLTVSDLLNRISASASHTHFHDGEAGRALDDYIEAQIHGPLLLSSDVQFLVADPSFRGTATGADLETLSSRYHFPLVWHRGFRVRFTQEIPSDFRGDHIAVLAKRLQKHYRQKEDEEFIHIELVGRAAVSVVQNPKAWEDYGTAAQSLQHLKQMWHVLVWFGEPLS